LITCLWGSPVVYREDIFSEDVYKGAKLNVPMGMLSKYTDILPWSLFSSISEIESSSVSDTMQHESKVTISGHVIEVIGNGPVKIISLKGDVCYNGQNNCSVSVDRGVYIVITESGYKKVII
jgi:hypothetical protein